MSCPHSEKRNIKYSKKKNRTRTTSFPSPHNVHKKKQVQFKNVTNRKCHCFIGPLPLTRLGTALWIVQYPVLQVNALRNKVRNNDIDLLFPAFQHNKFRNRSLISVKPWSQCVCVRVRACGGVDQRVAKYMVHIVAIQSE